MKRTVFIVLTAFIIGSILCVNHTQAQLFTETNPEGLPPVESPNPFQPEEIPPNTLIALVGDMGIDKNAQAVFNLIKAYNADMAFILGDLGYDGKDYYKTISRAKEWERMKDTTLVNNGIPVFIVVGNHELKDFPYKLIFKGNAWDDVHYPAYKKYIKNFKDKNGKNICIGDPGVLAACQYKGIFWIESAIKLIHTKDKHFKFTKEQLAQNDSIWKICNWHLNRIEMQVESLKDIPQWIVNWEMYTSCLNEGALIATGHQHSYQRTFTLNDLKNESRTSRTNERFNSPLTHNTIEHVEDADSRPPSTSTNPSVGPATFVTVSGLGGRPNIYPQQRCLDPKEKCYNTWDSVYAAPKAKPGVFFILFNPDGQGQRLAKFYFIDIDYKLIDSGWITSGNGSNVINNIGRTNNTPKIKDNQFLPPNCVDNYGVYSAMVGIPRDKLAREWTHDKITCSSEALVGAGPLVIPQILKRDLYNDQNIGCDKYDGYMTNVACDTNNCQKSTIECAHVPSKNKKLANIQWTPLNDRTPKKMDCQEFFGPKSVAVNVDFTLEGSSWRLKCADLVNP